MNSFKDKSLNEGIKKKGLQSNKIYFFFNERGNHVCIYFNF